MAVGIGDILDDTIESWRRERPELDFDGMALFLRMSAVVRSTIGEFRGGVEELGITLSEFDVLATLRRSGPKAALTPTYIAQVAMVKPSGLAHRLARLESAGLVTRTPDPDDGRGALIRITPTGRRVVDRAIELLAERKNQVFGVLTDRQRESLASLLDRVIRTDDVVRQSGRTT